MRKLRGIAMVRAEQSAKFFARERRTQLTGDISAILAAAYESFVRLMAARRYGRPTKVLERDVEMFVEMLGDFLMEGVSGHLVRAAALANLRQMRCAIEAQVVDERDRLDLDEVRRDFEARLAGSRAGCVWRSLKGDLPPMS